MGKNTCTEIERDIFTERKESALQEDKEKKKGNDR